MRNILFFLVLILFSTSIYAQIDSTILRKIDSCVAVDQKWRGVIRQVRNQEVDSIGIDFAIEMMNRTDSLNYLLLVDLYTQYGFLDYDKVGKEGSHQFWLLMQHQDKHPEFQFEVLEAMKIACSEQKASPIDYAYLIDRVKVNTKALQVFGTQMQLNIDSSSYEPKPVVKPEKLNKRRKEVGLFSIEQYIEAMNSRYFGTINKK